MFIYFSYNLQIINDREYPSSFQNITLQMIMNMQLYIVLHKKKYAGLSRVSLWWYMILSWYKDNPVEFHELFWRNAWDLYRLTTTVAHMERMICAAKGTVAVVHYDIWFCLPTFKEVHYALPLIGRTTPHLLLTGISYQRLMFPSCLPCTVYFGLCLRVA